MFINRLLLIFSAVIFSLNGFSNEYEGHGWTFSNEAHAVNFFEGVENLPSNGLYVSVGGDRAFTGAAMASEVGIEIDGVINIDRDPQALSFARLIPSVARIASTPNDLFHRLASLPEVSWSTWLRVMLKHYVTSSIDPKSIYLDNDLLFHLKWVSSNGHLKTYNLDFNDVQEWKPLFQYLERHGLKIAVLDISNMLDGYVTGRRLTLALEHLAPYFSYNAVIVNTQFCTRIGHVKTHVRHLHDFVYRLKGRTRSSLRITACITENVPGW